MDLRSWEWRYLWARSRGEERFTLCQYSNAVSALAFSPDGQWLAVRWENDILALWDPVAKQPVIELPARTATWRRRHTAQAFSPRGNFMAWANADSNSAPLVCLRDLKTGRELQPLRHTNDLMSLAFSPDGKLLAALDKQGAVLGWDVASGQCVAHFGTMAMKNFAKPSLAAVATPAAAEGGDRPPEPGLSSAQTPVYKSGSHREHYGRVVFSLDGRWLAVGAGQPHVRLWDRTAGKEVEPLVLPAAADGVTALAFSPDSSQLAAGGGYGYNDIYVWDLATRTERKLVGHGGWVTDLAFSPDGHRLASVSVDQTLRLWDIAGEGKPRCLRGNTAEVWAVAWSPDGRDLVTGARDGRVQYWDPDSKPTAPYAVLPASVWGLGLAFTPDSKTILAASGPGGVVERWDAVTLQRLEPLRFLGTNHVCLDISHDGRWLALGDYDGHLRVWEAWDSPARRLAMDLVFPESWIVAVLFSPQARYLNAGILAPPSNIAKFWELPTWREVLIEGINRPNLTGVSFCPDERTAARGSADGLATWWDLATGKKLATLSCPERGAFYVRFSPDGRWFATAGFNGKVTLWDVATQRPTPIGPDHPLDVYWLAFSPDGRRLITAGGTSGDPFWLWDVATGRSVATLPAMPGNFYGGFDFSPDGNTLYTGSLEGAVLFWRAPSWEEIEGEERVPRSGFPVHR